MTDIIEKARNFAINASKQYWYGLVPYHYHLNDVALKVSQVNLDSSKYTDTDSLDIATNNMIAAAWLHDSIEDHNISSQTIESEFNSDVAWLVEQVTNPSGKNKKEKNKLLFDKLSRVADSRVLIIKICDRISNVTSSLISNEDLYKMYKKEFFDFSNATYRDFPEMQKIQHVLNTLMIH